MGKKILVVEKEKKLFGELISNSSLKNISIQYCSDMFDAVKILSIYDFDVIIYNIDLEVPGTFFAIESAKYMCPDVYTIVVAKNGTFESIKKSKSYRIDLLEPKPIEVEQLIPKIILALEKENK